MQKFIPTDDQRLSQAKGVEVLTVAQQWTELRRRGSEFVGPCPVCKTGDDRFSVSPAKNVWNCRVCDKGGDVVSLVQAVLSTTFAEALDYLAGPLGSGTPTLRVDPKPRPPGSWQDVRWQLGASRMVSRCESALTSETRALAYLEARRISAATQRAFRLGWAPTWAGPKGKFQVDAITIPWILPTGEVCAVKGRRIDPGEKSRFIFAKGSSQILFGGHLAVGRESVIFVEGEFNAMSIWQAAGDSVDVLCFGGDSMGDRIAPVARHYRRRAVWMDEPAKVARLQERDRALTGYASPGGLDASDVLVKHGQDALRELVLALVADT